MPEFDQDTMTLFYEEAGPNDEDLTVPARWDSCSLCSGKGKHSLAVDGHGITAEEWEQDWDYEDREMYLSGGYDSQCEECDGTGAVPVPDYDRMSDEARKAVDNWNRAEAEYRAISAMERKYGA